MLPRGVRRLLIAISFLWLVVGTLLFAEKEYLFFQHATKFEVRRCPFTIVANDAVPLRVTTPELCLRTSKLETAMWRWTAEEKFRDDAVWYVVGPAGLLWIFGPLIYFGILWVRKGFEIEENTH
jgi:hypothetical protein